MSELTKILLNIRSLRVLSREMTLSQLEDALEKLTFIIKERQELEAQEQAALAEQEEKLSAIAAQIAKDGIDINALISALSNETKSKSKVKSPRTPRPAKYKYTDPVTNEEKTWTGQGRTPLAIQTLLDSGKSLTDFEI